MKGGIVILVGLTVALCVSSSDASECKIHRSNLDRFAHFRLGQRLRAIPKGVKRLSNCTVYPRHHAFDCEFSDGDGASYLADGHEIVRLVRVPEGASNLPLPAPLQFGMSIEDAVRALIALDPKITWTRGHSSDGDSLDSGECLKDSHGITYFMTLDFDRAGRLDKLTAAFDTAED